MTKWDLQIYTSLVLVLLARSCTAWADPQSVAATVCQVADISEPHESHVVTITAYVATAADGVYLMDNACPDKIIDVKFSPPYSADSGVDDWEDQLNPYRPPRDGEGGPLYCICTGEMRYTSGVPVLMISMVEKFWYVGKTKIAPPENPK